MTTAHLKFAPDIIRRLGEELVPHPDQGVLELARNSYDADAVNCRVELHKTENLGGAVHVSDDGIGMDIEGIQNGWLVLGHSNKLQTKVTPLGRRPVGDKGLGRLAAIRMGSTVTLKTRPAKQPGVEHRLSIDWAKYDHAHAVDDVPWIIETLETEQGQGTDIEISNLNVRLREADVQRLSRSLLLLADPFDNQIGFHTSLSSPKFAELASRVANSYFGEAAFHLTAKLHGNGKATAQVSNRNGTVLWRANHEDLSKTPISPYGTIPAVLELWIFILAGGEFSNRSVSLAEVRDWLRVLGGVHIYHRGLRVLPYGDPGHDWLDMNLARARDPQERPSTNTSIGRMIVIDHEGALLSKTDRSGFVEDDPFLELKRFAMDSLDWMARERLSAAEEARGRMRKETATERTQAKSQLEKAVAEVPVVQRPKIRQALRVFEQAAEAETKAAKDDLQLYRTLASVGTTTSVFAHEAAKPVDEIEKMAASIEKRAREVLKDKYEQVLGTPVRVIAHAANSLQTFANLPLTLLKSEKRDIRRIEVNEVVRGVLELFGYYLDEANVSCQLELVEEDPCIWGSIAALESILSNLLINCVRAFVEWSDNSPKPRCIVMRTELSSSGLLLTILDNGPGIEGLSLQDIWLPGQTTTSGGTGLGLTIVRDAVTDLGGAVRAIAHGELGGAEIIVELPTASDA